MNVEVKGLVLKTTNFKEADRILTVFTEEQGAISIIATGARSLKSRKMSSTMQFCYSSFVLTKVGEYYRIKEVELIESFYGIRNSIEGLALAGYIAEVLSDVTVAEADRELLRLSLNSLYAVSEGKHPIEKIKAAFELRCAAVLGFMPDVIGCTQCSKRSGDFYFDIMGGSILCYDCNYQRERRRAAPENPHESHIVCILTETAKVALEYVVHCPVEKIFSFNIPHEDMSLFSRAAEQYLLNQMERTYKTLDFYHEVVRQ